MDENLRQPYQGQLIKFTNVVKGWQSRWFVVDPEHGTLQYFLSECDKYEKARGGVQLAGAVISPSFEDSLTFTVSPADGESYKLRAQNTKDRQMWINRLRIIAEMHTRAIGHNHPPLAPREHRSKDTVGTSWLPTNFGGLDVIDAFTQVADILEETQRQHSALAQSIEELPSHGSGMRCLNPDVLLIKATSQATISCLDQCLCALRSQHTALQHSSRNLSINSSIATHQSKGLLSQSPLSSPRMGRSPLSFRRQSPLSLRRRSQSPQHPFFSVSPSHHQSLLSSKSRTAPQSPSPSNIISVVSQDASTSLANSLNDISILPLDKKIFNSSQNIQKEVNSPKLRHFKLFTEDSGSGSDSQLHENLSDYSTISSQISNRHTCEVDSSNSDTEVSDSEDIEKSCANGDAVEEGQRSVIMHIISQLRLGMDLTRVTLPTFILEKRSLLEMFADFLGHPDLFLKISTCETAAERILAVVKWYLTSIHVGRQGSIAKKPYNPIIGETFFCSWRVPVSTIEGKENVSSESQYYTIRYRSEQVSHHPPVSAFFIECPEKEMCVNAHIWTKSKFMGMSIGVNLVGNIHLVLGKFHETYQLGMPSAYARSVLMEPWVELGGRINIYCPQTDCSAPIIFHTKPFYGGKLHKVTCEVKTGGTLLCRVQGEWDSFLEFTYEDEREPEVLNLNELGMVFRKHVRPIDRQARNESRNLWYDVTKALSFGNLVTATNQKKSLEDQQRAEEQQRAADKIPFATKLFHSASPDQWVYNNLPKYAANSFAIGTLSSTTGTIIS